MNKNSFIHIEITKKPKLKSITPTIVIEDHKSHDNLCKYLLSSVQRPVAKIDSSHHFDSVKRSISKESSKWQSSQGKIRFLRFSKKETDRIYGNTPRKGLNYRSLSPISVNRSSIESRSKSNLKFCFEGSLPKIRVQNESFAKYYTKLRFLRKE
jgi:hypothetical protein